MLHLLRIFSQVRDELRVASPNFGEYPSYIQVNKDHKLLRQIV